MKAVRFDRYGDVDVLDAVEVPDPEPASSEVLVRVKAAGINPGEALVRTGTVHDRWPATFPSGNGSDLTGVERTCPASRLGALVTTSSASPTAARVTRSWSWSMPTT